MGKIKNLTCFLFLISLLCFSPGVSAESFKERFPGMTWDQITKAAKGQTVNWHMWGGNKAIIRWVGGYLKDRLNTEYDVTLNVVPLQEIKTAINMVRQERRKGIFSNGSIDLIWINGENFRVLKKGKMLFQFADKLPNMQYVDKEKPSIKLDFGYPVDGYESPFGGAQFVFNYNSAKVLNPPKSMEDLLAWIKKNPNKFTYPHPPNFTGSVFIRHVFYHVAGGYQNLLGPFDEDLFDKYSPELWKVLNEIKPYLWKKGRVYPAGKEALDQLVKNKEVYFGMSYACLRAAHLIKTNVYPETMKTFVFDEGTISNTHYLAIPFNAENKAGAMVLANLILDPATQFEKMKPEVWGDQPILDINRLPETWKHKFESFPRHPSLLSSKELFSHQNPELQSSWLLHLEEGWDQHVKTR